MPDRLSKDAVFERERTLSDAETVRRARKAVELELEKRRAMDMPIAVYDKKTRKVYACFADGTKIDMEEYKKNRLCEEQITTG